MKKVVLIFFLIIFNILLVYSKVSSKSDINLDLKENELAIVVIDNTYNKSVLLIKNDQTILYVLDYEKGANLKSSLEKFTSNIDYVFENEDYPLNFKNTKIISDIMIDNIYLTKNRINYSNFNFCFNESNCDFTYLTDNQNIVSSDNIIYNEDIDDEIIEDKKQEWLDMYKVGKDNFLIIIIKEDNYEITNLMR